MTNQTKTTETTDYYNFTDDDNRVWTLRPVPKHFYLMFGQLLSAAVLCLTCIPDY